MQVDEAQLFELAETIWSSVLGLPLVQTGEGAGVAPPAQHLTSCVHITGTWDGAVTLDCPEPLARRAAGIMFGLEPEAASEDEVRDALGELANMIGGNVKALLPPPCQLSLPTVMAGLDFTLSVPGSELVRRIVLDCEGVACTVTILAKTSTKH